MRNHSGRRFFFALNIVFWLAFSVTTLDSEKSVNIQHDFQFSPYLPSSYSTAHE